MKQSLPISVIIPCYRCGKTIERALISILNQTLLPKEVVLVDDNDDKSEVEYLNDLVNQYSSLNIIMICNIRNYGAPTARNIAWNSSSGDYVAFLDSDDAWHPQKLELQYEFMRQNQDILFSGHNIEVLNDDVYSHKQHHELTYNECNKTCILLKNIFPTPTLMIKRSCHFRFDETMRYVDDHLLLMNLILSDHKAYKINQKLAYVFKPMYGATGLSANMYMMEKHELIAYQKIYKSHKINRIVYISLYIFSILKYVRRLFLNYIKSKSHKKSCNDKS